jgi:hypothetical protein
MKKNLLTAYTKISIHYVVLVVLTVSVLKFFPGVVDFLPVGASERLFSTDGIANMESAVYAGRFEDGTNLTVGIFFFVCFLTALLLSIPVGTTFMSVRRGKKRTASLAKMIVILPVAVTGLVLIVQNSLALAFSLAGIVAGSGIRFRTNMREFTDTLFFLVSIGIGLAAGVGALGLALIMSAFFCYTMLTFHLLDYGGQTEDQSESMSEMAGEYTDEKDN